MRVCALYEQKRWVVTLLLVAFISSLASTLTFATSGLLAEAREPILYCCMQRVAKNSLGAIQPTSPFNICYTPTPPGMWAVWLPSLIFECLIFFLTIVRVVHYIDRDVSTPGMSIQLTHARYGTNHYLSHASQWRI